MASAQVYISKQSFIYIWVLRGARMLLIGCCIVQSRQRIDHSRQHCQEEPGGGQRLRTGKKFYWNTSLMQNPQSQALVSPSSGCLALLVLKKKTIIRDVQFLELHTCILICVSSGFGWWSLLLKYWEGVSFHICCIAKQPGKSLEMILSPANHDDQFKNCRSACFACSEAFVADSAAVKKFDFPKLAQNNVGFFLLPITTIY